MASILAKMGLDTKDFSQKLERVEGRTKKFADKFGSTLGASLPALSRQHIDDPRLLGPNKLAALAHQRAVRSAMKKDQKDLRSSMDTPAEQEYVEAMLAALQPRQQPTPRVVEAQQVLECCARLRIALKLK